MARCSDCKLVDGRCPLKGAVLEARKLLDGHDCSIFKPREVVARARKLRKIQAERDFLLDQGSLL